MTHKITNSRHAKRRKQLKRRRIFWTALFMLLGAYTAFHAVNFGKSYFSETPAATMVKLPPASEQNQTQNTAPAEVAKENTAAEVKTEVAADAPKEVTQRSTGTKEQPAGNLFTVSTADQWQYVLVNKAHPVDKSFAPEATFLVQGNYKADARIEAAVTEMFEAAKADGVALQACSAFRTFEYQQKLFNKLKAKYSNLSDEAAAAEAAKSIAKPGTSEHQTGLALDIVTPEYTQLNAGFAKTKAGKWLAANAHTYGFILRYPKDKTEITQIIFEPWHFRYVGKEAAKIIFEEDLCYEEFYERIQFQE